MKQRRKLPKLMGVSLCRPWNAFLYSRKHFRRSVIAFGLCCPGKNVMQSADTFIFSWEISKEGGDAGKWSIEIKSRAAETALFRDSFCNRRKEGWGPGVGCVDG